MQAVIMAGGKGTRLAALTKDRDTEAHGGGGGKTAVIMAGGEA